MSERTFSLDVIGVQTPCHEHWDAMTGDAQKRFCDQCEKHVHNLSAMTRDEAEAFITANPTDVCIRMHKDAQGRVITADKTAPTGPALQHRRRIAAHALLPALAILASGAAGIAGCSGSNSDGPTTDPLSNNTVPTQHQTKPTQPMPPPIEPGPVLMGDICIKPEPQAPAPDPFANLTPDQIETIYKTAELPAYIYTTEILQGMIIQTPPDPTLQLKLQELIELHQQQNDKPKPDTQPNEPTIQNLIKPVRPEHGEILLGRIRAPQGDEDLRMYLEKMREAERLRHERQRQLERLKRLEDQQQAAQQEDVKTE